MKFQNPVIICFILIARDNYETNILFPGAPKNKYILEYNMIECVFEYNQILECFEALSNHLLKTNFQRKHVASI